MVDLLREECGEVEIYSKGTDLEVFVREIFQSRSDYPAWSMRDKKRNKVKEKSNNKLKLKQVLNNGSIGYRRLNVV